MQSVQGPRQAATKIIVDVRSPQRARFFVTGRLQAWGAEAVCDEAEVLVSELVTNAVVHAGTPSELRLSLAEGVLRVEVSDENPAPLQMRAHQPGATSGRGLRIVEALAARWGVDREGEGKTVWFELPLPT